MKRIAVLIIFILSVSLSWAQEISSRSLDSLSALISKNQSRAEGLPYKINENDPQTLSFPKENFRIWYYNKLATHAVRKTSGNKEILEITEDIDLSKAYHLGFHHFYFHGSSPVYTYRIWFPANEIQTQIYENGKLVRKETRSHIDIIDLRSARNERSSSDYHKAYLTLGYTINLLMNAKTQSGYDLQQINNDLIASMDENEEEEYLNFQQKYPQSIYNQTVISLLRPFEKAREKEKSDISYVDNFLSKFKVRKGLNENNIFYEIPEAAYLRQHKQGSCYYQKKLNKKDKPAVGPYAVNRVCYSVGNPDLSSYSYIMYVSASQEEVLRERDKLIEEFTKNIADKYISKQPDGVIIVHPRGYNKGVRITIKHDNYTRHQQWYFYTVSFSEFDRN
ncbi:MAG: hypothetical protein ACTHMC_28460 [Pseudobacter sp.]|uniref:hypothetical protein n=1 Tax=Pseudobacter sp. TaxID=2045420 RepID=UPI003F8104AC